ncbi:hypothetical protein MJT46_016253 [Ovis ammon polii x Ovis aries]|nr:hypothetical protein MJT46_016253 [Ovis ammon polii x Ovis aries]
MPAFETRTDSPGETPEEPQDPCQHWRGIPGSGPDSTQGLRPRHRRERNPERPPKNSHGDWPFLRPPERVPEGPVVSREHLPQLQKIQEVLPSRRGKEFPAFPSHLKRRRSPQERREELEGHATIPRVPQMCQSIPEERIFPALPRRSIRASTPNTVARGTALRESLVGKPRGKDRDPLIHAEDCITLLLPLWRKPQVHARIRDED